MHILNLPPNVVISIFSYLGHRDLINSARKTCKLWYQLSHEKILWKTVHMQKFHNLQFCARTFNDMLSKVSDSVEILCMDLKQLDSAGVLHENVVCSTLTNLLIYYEDSQSIKNGRVDYTLYCHDGALLHTYLPVLSEKYPNLKGLQLYSHVIHIEDLVDVFLELEKIEIEYCDLSKDGADMFVERFFSNHKKIKHLSIRFSVLDSEVLSFILCRIPGLISLDLSNSNFSCDEISLFGIQQQGLQKLVLTNTRSSDNLLGSLVKSASGLKYISIGDCVELTNNGLEFLSENCPYLETLIINEVEYSKCNITNSGLQMVAERCKNIRVLKIVYCDEIGDVGVQAITKACAQLTVIEAAGCTAITDAAVFSIMKNCPLIEKLDLGHCVQLTSASVNEVFLSCPNLRYLNLETCHRLSDIDLENWSTVKSDSVLHTLHTNEYVSHCDTKSVSCDDIEVTLEVENEFLNGTSVEDNFNHIQERFSKQEVIQKRTEKSETTGDEHPTCTSPLVYSFPWHCHIRTLNLGFCSKISNKCVKQIAKFCPDLQCLNLQGCAMVTNAGVLALAQGCRYLCNLNISGGSVFQSSRLTDDCLHHISKYCSNLIELSIIKNNHVTTEGIFEVIKKCPKIKELSFAASRSHATRGITPESLTKAAGEVQGKTICIKIIGNNAKVTVALDLESKLKSL